MKTKRRAPSQGAWRACKPARIAAPVAAALGLLLLGCGYHLNTKGSNLPPHIQSIGIPQFANQTNRSELGQHLTEKVRDQFIARGKYRISPEVTGVDATLTGTVLSWSSRPVELAQQGSTAQKASVTLRASVKFEDLVEKRVRWQSDDYTFTAEYDVIGDPERYFDTELGAVDKISEDFARALASAIMQGF